MFFRAGEGNLFVLISGLLQDNKIIRNTSSVKSQSSYVTIVAHLRMHGFCLNLLLFDGF